MSFLSVTGARALNPKTYVSPPITEEIVTEIITTYNPTENKGNKGSFLDRVLTKHGLDLNSNIMNLSNLIIDLPWGPTRHEVDIARFIRYSYKFISSTSPTMGWFIIPQDRTGQIFLQDKATPVQKTWIMFTDDYSIVVHAKLLNCEIVSLDDAKTKFIAQAQAYDIPVDTNLLK